mgnify:CR=1 FL=1
MSIIEPKILKGFRDSLPAEETERKRLFAILERTFTSFGFVPIDTPVLEYTQVLLGKGKGKKQVYGIHTTRGIINGSEHFGIRSVRTDRYLYIRNLTPETEFRCAAFNDSFFKSWTEIEMDAFNHIASKMHVK